MRNRVAWGVATVALLGVGGVVTSIVRALPPGSPAAPGMVLTPTSGDSSTEMTLSLTSPDNVCPGDTATGNYRWNTFMAPSSVDVGTLTYNNQGPISPAGVTVRPLFSAIGGSSIVNKATAVQTGQIVGTSTVSFAVFAPGDIAPGSYKIGYSCTKAPALGQPAQTERFWQVEIAVTQSATGGPAQIAWTSGTAPTTTTTTTVAPTTTTTTVADTTTTTTTIVADTTTTTTIVDGTTTSTTTTTVPGSTSTTVPGSTSTTVSAPTTTIPASTTSTTMPSGPTTTLPGGPPPAPTQQVTQNLGVTKNGSGALVLTQRCGVFGALPASSDTDLGPVAAQSETNRTNTVGTTSPCGVEFGTAKLITSGPKEGLYFAATGRLSQLTVTDTRTGNLPWTVTGVASDFNNGGNGANDSFSGNFLGWQPIVSSVSGTESSNSGPGSKVTPGPVVEPSPSAGLGSPKVLASTMGGRGAGSVKLDARLKLYIPASVSDGRFTATLTFTVI